MGEPEFPFVNVDKRCWVRIEDFLVLVPTVEVFLHRCAMGDMIARRQEETRAGISDVRSTWMLFSKVRQSMIRFVQAIALVALCVVAIDQGAASDTMQLVVD